MSIVLQDDEVGVLGDHVDRLRAAERSGSIWIYVGTFGVDGVDDLVTPDSPPFENGWTNALGVEAPVSFTRINGWIHLRGGFVGGSAGTVVFTLPVGYLPAHRHRSVIGTSATNHYATVYVEPTGEVVFGTVV